MEPRNGRPRPLRAGVRARRGHSPLSRAGTGRRSPEPAAASECRTPGARVALATCADVPPEFGDDELLAEALRRRSVEASFVDWDHPRAEWSDYDLVVIRSTWDYTGRREDFLVWADAVGERLRNPPAVVRWNSDKRYMADLAAAGLAVVPTRFVEPHEGPTPLEGEVVVKPTVSAGARDTGRFGVDAHDGAHQLLARIAGSGRTAMVQPYLEGVDRAGETALVFVAGEFSHALRKRAVLGPDEVAPLRGDALGAAEAMYDPSLVTGSTAEPDEVEMGRAILDHVSDRFGAVPLYARVDLVRDDDSQPLLMELEAIEPSLYLHEAPATAERLAEAVIADARSTGATPSPRARA